MNINKAIVKDLTCYYRFLYHHDPSPEEIAYAYYFFAATATEQSWFFFNWELNRKSNAVSPLYPMDVIKEIAEIIKNEDCPEEPQLNEETKWDLIDFISLVDTYGLWQMLKFLALIDYAVMRGFNNAEGIHKFYQLFPELKYMFSNEKMIEAGLIIWNQLQWKNIHVKEA